MTTQTKYEGMAVRAGGRELTVPALSYRFTKGLVREQMPVLSGISGTVTPEQEKALFDVLLASLRRNYPDLDEAFLLDECSPADHAALLQAVLKATFGIGGESKDPNAQGPTK